MTRSIAPQDEISLQAQSMTRSRTPDPAAPWLSARSLISLLLSAILAACGGGNSSETKASPATVTPTIAVPQSTLAGRVASIAVPVTVTVQLVDPDHADQSITLATTALLDGSFSISAPTIVIPKNTQIAAVVTADGYLPTTIVYSTSTSGDLTATSVTNALGTLPIAGPVVLTPVAENTFAFPGLETLKRLGDGYAPGSVNSRLQLPPPPAGQPLVKLASQRVPYSNAAKTRLSVSLLARGIEASACPGTQALLRVFDSAGTEMSSQSKPMFDTPTTGDFASQTFVFDLDAPAMLGGEYQVEISTAYCGGNDYDDMEFVGVTGTLN